MSSKSLRKGDPTANPVNVERKRAGMGYIDIMQRDPEQAGCNLAHQLARNVDGKFVGAGEGESVGLEVVQQSSAVPQLLHFEMLPLSSGA